MMATLAPLPYALGALAPTIDARTVRIHHGVHQASYVRGWNEGKEPAFNGAGVILHELYWENLCAAGHSPPPSPGLATCVHRCFRSFDRLVQEMVEKGAKVEGSGWVVLCWIPRFNRMVVLPIEIHQNGWIPTAVPLLVIDVWEHAYYLQYQADRRQYLRLIWHNVDWGVVSRRYAEAT
jgi:Fe-Mn family superoxide dismutase